MAFLGDDFGDQMRRQNKEPEWSSICNNVFDQYLDSDDLFGYTAEAPERSSSDDSVNLFDFSTGSEQSNQTDGTSPITSWEYGLAHSKPVIAQQPQAQEPLDFWTRTLHALEENAAATEHTQRELRTAKSHPDFLSLGGCPTPPAAQGSPPDHARSDRSRSIRSRKSRPAANGRKPSQARSASRGRPTGVTKCTAAVQGAANVGAYATVRKCSASPSKMMTPSRYRADFKDVWQERSTTSPKKYALRAASQGFPTSPPFGRTRRDYDFAALGSPGFGPSIGYDEQLSPLTKGFQHVHIHTPISSPALNAVAYAHNAAYFQDDVPPLPTLKPYAPVTLPLNDTAPLYPVKDRTSSLATKLQAFDFGFEDSQDIWQSEAQFDSGYTVHPYKHYHDDPFGPLDTSVLPSIETDHMLNNMPYSGLGISCDPSMMSNHTTDPHALILNGPAVPTTISSEARRPSPTLLIVALSHTCAPLSPPLHSKQSNLAQDARSHAHAGLLVAPNRAALFLIRHKAPDRVASSTTHQTTATRS